jgi:hypothetical protein
MQHIHKHKIKFRNTNLQKLERRNERFNGHQYEFSRNQGQVNFVYNIWFINYKYRAPSVSWERSKWKEEDIKI